MFDTLTGRLDGIFKKLRSRGKLHPKQVDNALTDMRMALLEADVSVEVADDILARVRARALSEEVMQSLTPAQQVVKVVRDELQETMGGTQASFQLPSTKPAIVMMFGEDDRLREARAPDEAEGQATAPRRGRSLASGGGGSARHARP
jgi:signal recognition particle subunit SRP54